MLCQYMKPRKTKPQAPVVMPREGLQFLNAFSGLLVEEPDTPCAHLDYDLPSSTPVAIARDEEAIEEEFLFPISAFMKEVQKLRFYLLTMWTKYWDGEVDLIMPSVLANTAIRLVRKAENQLDSLVQRPKRYPAAEYPSSSFAGILMWEEFKNDLEGKTDKRAWTKAQIGYNRKPAVSHSNSRRAELCMWDRYNGLDVSLANIKPVKGGFDMSALANFYINPDPKESDLKLSAYFHVRRMAFWHGSIASGTSQPVVTDEITRAVTFMQDTCTISSG